MIATRELTPRQRQILEFMETHLLETQSLPTFDEMCQEFGIASKNGITCHIRPLIKKGYLARAGHKARSYKLLLGADGCPFRLQRREDCL